MGQIEGSPYSREMTLHTEPAVIEQMRRSLRLRKDILSRRFPEADLDRETAYLTQFYEVGLKERIVRGEEVESPEVKEADKIARRILKSDPYRIACVDERNKYETVFGFSPGIGGDYRIPAGNPKEFVLSQDNTVALLPGSNYAKALDGLLEKEHDNIPVLILDCHLDCTAQHIAESGKKPSTRRKKQEDHGLLQDIRRKVEIEKAVRVYAEKKYQGKPIDIVLTSYDPETNFMYMGMEQEALLKYAEEHGGFTHGVLTDLVENKDVISAAGGKIISTAQIAADPRVQAVFDHHFFILDWKESFKETTLNYWTHVESIMGTEVTDIIREQVTQIYPNEAPEKIENRVQLLLLNAYSGYLHNRADIVVRKHNANTVIVSERQYGSFPKVSGFQVSSHSQSIPEDVYLANSIVEENRENGTAIDFTGTYDDYGKAPHADMLQKIDRQNSPIWEKLSEVDFSDLAQIDWRNMTEADFTKYLNQKYPEITVNASNILNYLRGKAAEFLDPAKPTAQQIIDGDLHVLYTVTDTNRRPVFILPLEYRGYTG